MQRHLSFIIVETQLFNNFSFLQQIQTLLAPPKSEEVEKRSRKLVRDVRRSGRATNHDTCDSCREGGRPALLRPLNPPLSEEMLPPGEWMCHRCNVRKKVSLEFCYTHSAVWSFSPWYMMEKNM
uniref:Uncharacterized protein n=1 Tax=Sphaeramia orbicularis TaxID=375764 RepID=A0A672ZE76_9TELE